VAGANQITADGLEESIRFLGKVDKELRKEAVGIVKKWAVKVKTVSQGRLRSSPGVQRNGYPLSKTAIIHRASGKGGSVGINRASRTGRNAAIFPAEFGAFTQFVPYNTGNRATFKARGRHIGQNDMRRRTFPVWRGNQFKPRGSSGPGWIVLPTIRRMVPMIERDLEADMAAVFDKAARKYGVPRGV